VANQTSVLWDAVATKGGQLWAWFSLKPKGKVQLEESGTHSGTFVRSEPLVSCRDAGLRRPWCWFLV